jgi:hypothetical protein
MPTTTDLINLGVPDELARRLGFMDNNNRRATPLTGVGTAQVGGAAIKKNSTWIELATAGGQTACVLPADAEILVPYLVQVITTSTTGLVFPPSGGKINAAAADASVNVAQFLPRLFFRLTSTQWMSLLAA